MAFKAAVIEAPQGHPKKYPFFVFVVDTDTGRRASEHERDFESRAEAVNYAKALNDGEAPKVRKEGF